MWVEVGKMKTLELRALLDGKEKVIEIPVEIQKIYNLWKEKRGDEVLNPLEIFYAGYVLSNPMLRDKYRKSNQINVEYN